MFGVSTLSARSCVLVAVVESQLEYLGLTCSEKLTLAAD